MAGEVYFRTTETDYMSFSVKLGEGGYGAVYRGQFPGGSNVPVAVKLLTNKKGTGEDFENEVTTISRASHCNIISLLGYCLEGSHRALVYEYMQNGSLDLYKFGSIFDSIERKQLQWHKLYEIIVGVARGIDYLCTGCRTQIVHFDIKPQNILLDHNLRPKISDFRLAKLRKKKRKERSIFLVHEALMGISHLRCFQHSMEDQAANLISTVSAW